MKRFENLKIWQNAYQLTLRIYLETRAFPKEELYGMVSQMRRAASSVAANIAEGSLRASKKEFVQFLHISLGSLGELETLLRLSKDLGYLNSQSYSELHNDIEDLSKMIEAFAVSERKTNGAFALVAVVAFFAVVAPSFARPLYFMDEKLTDRSHSWAKTEKFSKDIAPKYRRDKIAELKSIRLEIAPDLEKKEVKGTVTHTYKILAPEAEQIELDSVELKIKEVKALKDNKSKELEFEVLPEKLLIHLDKKYKAGETLTIQISYEGSPKMGLLFFNPDPDYPTEPLLAWTQGQPEDNRYWVPAYDYPNDRTSSEMLVTVPEKLTAVSNGKLMGKKPGPKPGTVVYHWLQERPHSTYLLTLTVGEFATIEEPGTPPLTYYFRPGKEKEARLGFKHTRDMMDFFVKTLEEPYPWEGYSQLALYGFRGGMENTSATNLTERVLLDEKARLDVDTEPLLSHELAHQWFGDLLTCKDWAHIWLNEGFATYFEMLYMRHLKGKDQYSYELYTNAQNYFGEAGQYQRPIVTEKYNHPWDMFDAHTYPKGAWVLHMLSQEVGEDFFWKAMKKYLRDYKDKNVETEDFRRTFEEVTGKSLLKFFNQWVYGPGHPQLKIKLEWDSSAKKAKLKVVQTQADEKHPPFSFKLPIEFQVRSLLSVNVKSFEASVEKAEENFEWELPSRPKMIRIDPDQKVLKSLELEIPQDMLITQLENDSDPAGKIWAIETLSKSGNSPEVLEALEKTLKNDSFWGVQKAAAQALGKIGGQKAKKILISQTGHPHPKSRKAVMEALGAFLKDEEALEALKKPASKDSSYLVEQAALTSLGKLRLDSAMDVLKSRLAEDSWTETVRRGALAGIGSLKKEENIPLLKEWSSPGKHVLARGAAFSALAQTAEGKDEPRDFLAQILQKEEDPQIKASAIGALQALGDPKAIPALAQTAARDPSFETRENAQEAIDNIREGKKGKIEDVSKQLDQLREDYEKLKKRLDEFEKKK